MRPSPPGRPANYPGTSFVGIPESPRGSDLLDWGSGRHLTPGARGWAIPSNRPLRHVALDEVLEVMQTYDLHQ